jgi:hypothetical protein
VTRRPVSWLLGGGGSMGFRGARERSKTSPTRAFAFGSRGVGPTGKPRHR